MDQSNLDLLRPWDKLWYSGGDILSDIIRPLEIEVNEGRAGSHLKAIIDGLKNATNQSIPIHTAVVSPNYTVDKPLRYEMTAPVARETDMLIDLKNLVGVSRNPWLQPETNPDCAKMLQDGMEAYWRGVLGKTYGYVDLVAYPFLKRPISESHLICSETAIDAELKVIDVDPRFPCGYPQYFKCAGPDNVEEVGNVSPEDISVIDTSLNRVIWRM